eukprot:Gb_09441 [translate_table: standard]
MKPMPLLEDPHILVRRNTEGNAKPREKAAGSPPDQEPRRGSPFPKENIRCQTPPEQPMRALDHPTILGSQTLIDPQPSPPWADPEPEGRREAPVSHKRSVNTL